MFINHIHKVQVFGNNCRTVHRYFRQIGDIYPAIKRLTDNKQAINSTKQCECKFWFMVLAVLVGTCGMPKSINREHLGP